eukprot:2208573-Pleurochrysis_carterae.AAC.3
MRTRRVQAVVCLENARAEMRSAKKGYFVHEARTDKGFVNEARKGTCVKANKDKCLSHAHGDERASTGRLRTRCARKVCPCVLECALPSRVSRLHFAGTALCTRRNLQTSLT